MFRTWPVSKASSQDEQTLMARHVCGLVGKHCSGRTGYTAAGDPLTVYDDNAKLAARVGQDVVFAGGLVPPGVRTIVGCDGFTEFWGVGYVVQAH